MLQDSRPAEAVRLLRAATLRPMPWKNGGGSTVEIAVFPKGAGFDDFVWRLSMADVGTDGPFSRFAGIDRTLVLLEGQGLTLVVEGAAHDLCAAGAALSFSGDAETVGRLRAGPVRDFNVMTRRGRFVHTVETLGPGHVVPTGPALILALDDLSVDLDGAPARLQRFDSLLFDAACPATLDGPALLVQLRPA